MLGYFPDTFGNMGQTPQMMKQANLHSAAFGRGVKPIGFDNEVLPDDQFTSQYSEMNWRGPDGSEIFGLLLPTGIPMAMRFRLIGKKHTSFGLKNCKMLRNLVRQIIT